MAEELDDGEFWLPSQFLTDDDILNDFSNSDAFGSGPGSGSSSDLGSTESSDDDDQLLLSGLPRQFSQSSLDCPVHSKGWVLSSSPQSTLWGCDCNHRSSSIGTPSGPVSPPKAAVSAAEKDGTTSYKGGDDDDDDENKTAKNSTLDLLNKAAGEVAKMKMRSEGVGRSTVGTGFFDCSNSAKGLLCPPTQAPLAQPQTNLTHFNPFYSHPHFHHFSPMMWRPHHFPIPPPPQQQNRVTETTAANTNSTTNSTTAPARPLGLPPSAWPPLPGQTQAQAQTQSPPPQQPPKQPPQPQQPIPMMGMFVGQAGQKGTGVFLPRRVTPTEPKKKTDGNATKTKTNKGSQRRNNRTPKTIDDEIQLPPEWVY